MQRKLGSLRHVRCYKLFRNTVPRRQITRPTVDYSMDQRTILRHFGRPHATFLEPFGECASQWSAAGTWSIEYIMQQLYFALGVLICGHQLFKGYLFARVKEQKRIHR